MKRLIWVGIGFLLGIAFMMSLPFWAWGEGNLTVEPSYDLLQGNGGIFSFDSDVHLFNEWYAVPNASLSTVEKYRDAACGLDLEYKWTDRIRTSFGASYDSYHHFGDDRVQSEDVHLKLKYKLWN